MTIHGLENHGRTPEPDTSGASPVRNDGRRFDAQYAAARPAGTPATGSEGTTIRRKPVPTRDPAPATTSYGNGGVSIPLQHLTDVARTPVSQAPAERAPAAQASSTGSTAQPPKTSPLSVPQMNVRDSAIGALQNNHGYMRKAESQIAQGEAGGAKGFFQKHVWHTNRFNTDIAGAQGSERAVKGHLTDLDALIHDDKLEPSEKQDKIKAKTADLDKAVQDYNSKLSGVKKEDKNSRANDALKWGIGATTTPVTKLIP